jgi:ribose 5-phosphate isomerase
MEKNNDGRRDTSKLSMDEQDELNETLRCVKGVFELFFASTEKMVEVDTESIRFVIMDAEKKLDKVGKCIERLTAA